MLGNSNSKSNRYYYAAAVIDSNRLSCATSPSAGTSRYGGNLNNT